MPSGAADMCGLLPCEFWRVVVVHPHESLAVAFGVGFFVGVLVLAGVQAVRQ